MGRLRSELPKDLDPQKRSFALNFQRLIDASGKSVADLARLAGNHRTTWYKITRGEGIPDFADWPRFAAVLGCELADLIPPDFPFPADAPAPLIRRKKAPRKK